MEISAARAIPIDAGGDLGTPGRNAALLRAQDAMGIGILLVENNRPTYVNDAYCRLTGWEAREILSPSWDPLCVIAPEARTAQSMRIDARAAMGILDQTYETVMLRRDGTRRRVEVSVHGASPGIAAPRVVVVRDVTERKEAEEAKETLALLRMQLAASERHTTLGSLLGGVAHEVRTPLTSLSNHLTLLEKTLERAAPDLPEGRRDVFEARAREHLAEAQESVARINKLVLDLRHLARERPLAPRAPERIDELASLAAEVFRATHRGQVEVVIDARPTPEVVVDRLQLQHAILHLLENAREASPAHKSVTLRTYADAEGAAVVEVRDEGAGIRDDVALRMWDAFYSTKEGGTGLGLSIVKRIAEKHDARIEVETTPGAGTTMRLRFTSAAPRPASP